ncbi:MAG: hypothetical protein E6108_03490 [Clostridium perfringens]|uniref:DUF3592 domain-containing protein n=2 Tax=Clostridium perfringens TaxID=1502 RepID=A0AB35RYM9_CLOPF|nr:hypothetical protein [Clostridium perfringens]ASY51210.1 hypothetical protein BG908_05915 [Clostridium perfringens]AWS25713.1 hypothetical protein CYK96_08895 [Clostridium perfringens]EDT28082.1 hypothetical protein AC5_1174 [Clostridium perfringens CPE str. F4969]EGT0679245.1 hypothetical protein [Clostridium perfringens]EHR1329259.1 hypothetical protein [Clostridium perfringens]
MENNKVKVWFLKLVVSLGSLLIIYTIASDLYKIAYLEFKGVETTGKLITFNEKINSGKFKSKSYTPVVRIKVYGQEIDVPAKLNKIDKDLVDFVGDEVKVKYSSKDYNLLIINDKKYLLNRINYMLLAVQILIFALLSVCMKATCGEDGKVKWIMKKKNPFLNLIFLIPGVIFSFSWIYYQIILGKYAMEQFDFIGALGTFMFLLVYIIIASSFIKSNKKFHKV